MCRITRPEDWKELATASLATVDDAHPRMSLGSSSVNELIEDEMSSARLEFSVKMRLQFGWRLERNKWRTA